MQWGARFNIVYRFIRNQLPWSLREERGARVGETVERIGDRRGRAEGGGRTTKTHLKNHIRGETFVQKDLVYDVVHACAIQASKPV